MKTTLKRLGNGDYKLYNTDGSCMATTKESPHKKLSKPNCDEIFKTLSVEETTTEIEVEIEMVCPHPSDTYRCGLEFGCDEDGCSNPNQVQHLDENGCLILRKL